MACHASTAYEISTQSALAELNASLPLLMELTEAAGDPDSITLNRFWHKPAGTFTYHTITPVNDADAMLLERAATLFLHANTLAHQAWYPAFIKGSNTSLRAPLPPLIDQAYVGLAHFDFGLRRKRYYRQLIGLMQPSSTIRVIALRSISGPPDIDDEVRAYTLTPTADIVELRGNRLYWHHIVTVHGAALLPPSADRLMMNLLRCLRLDYKERRTYLAEAKDFQALCAATQLEFAALQENNSDINTPLPRASSQ